jgi:hypothetical protein
MTWAMSSGIRSNIKKIAVTAAFVAIPTAVLSGPAYAAAGLGGTTNAPVVLPAPMPADPPQPPPGPPPPPPPAAQPSHGEYYNTNDQNDWWPYAGTGSF